MQNQKNKEGWCIDGSNHDGDGGDYGGGNGIYNIFCLAKAEKRQAESESHTPCLAVVVVMVWGRYFGFGDRLTDRQTGINLCTVAYAT